MKFCCFDFLASEVEDMSVIINRIDYNRELLNEITQLYERTGVKPVEIYLIDKNFCKYASYNIGKYRV